MDLGHLKASKRVVSLVDFEVNVFGLDEIAGSTLPIVPLVSAPLNYCLWGLLININSSLTDGPTTPRTWTPLRLASSGR